MFDNAQPHSNYIDFDCYRWQSKKYKIALLHVWSDVRCLYKGGMLFGADSKTLLKQLAHSGWQLCSQCGWHCLSCVGCKEYERRICMKEPVWQVAFEPVWCGLVLHLQPRTAIGPYKGEVLTGLLRMVWGWPCRDNEDGCINSALSMGRSKLYLCRGWSPANWHTTETSYS